MPPRDIEKEICKVNMMEHEFDRQLDKLIDGQIESWQEERYETDQRTNQAEIDDEDSEIG